MDARQKKALEEFDVKHIGLSKGALSFALIITRNLKTKQFPVAADEFRTAQEGQVAGLGGGAVRKILKEHGIERVLSDEGGRTSRGNMGRLRAYLDVLNALWRDNALDLDEAEKFWVSRVRAYFDSQPFTFKLDPVKSLRQAVRHTIWTSGCKAARSQRNHVCWRGYATPRRSQVGHGLQRESGASRVFCRGRP